MQEPLLIPDGAKLSIGRDIDSDLVLESGSVSRRHARITRAGDQVFIEDVGSSNGTSVAGKRIGDRTELRTGDLVRLGSATLKFFANASLESEYHQKLVELATRDGLTGLRNRSFFMDLLKRRLPQQQLRAESMSIAIVDLDHFKLINDEFGHDAGDRALQMTAYVLRNGLGEADLAARIGGEEFGLVFDTLDAEQAKRTLVALQGTLAEAAQGTGQPALSFSAGVVSVPAGVEADGAPRLLKAADVALYRAKENGRNRVEIAED
ncbi:MAG: GGDEF domain-containing protein [Pseudomonadota bacterium]